MSFKEKVTLKDVAIYSADKIHIDNINKDNYISTENLLSNYGGKIISSGLPNVKTVSEYKMSDVLISNIRPYFKKIWRAKFDGGASNDVLVIRAKENIIPEFLYYNLANNDFFDYVMSGTKGTKMPRGDKKHIMDFEINLPPIPEQKAIAHILSTLDEKIEVNNKINKTLENMAQSIFKEWFVDFEFPNEEGEPYKSSGGEMIESELGMIPKGWEVGKISDIGDVIGGSTPSKKKDEYYTSEGIPWITPKDLSENKNIFIGKGAVDITEDGFKSTSVKKMPAGTVLFSSRAPIGYIAIAKNEVTTNQGFKSIVPNEDNGFSSMYIYCWLKDNLQIIENRASGSTFKEISGGELKQISAIIPEFNILTRFKKIDFFKLIEILEKENANLRTSRDSFLPKLMSGEIRVPF